jgi:hypothetical protein
MTKQTAKFVVTSDLKRLGAMIGNIKLRLGSLNEDIQLCVMSCVLAAIEHSDVASATRLYEACTGLRQRALVVWLAKHGPFGFAGKTKDKAEHFTLDKAALEDYQTRLAKNRDTFLAKMDKDKWWDAVPPERIQGFDLVKELGRLLSRAEKAKENDKVAHHPDTKISDKLLSKLKSLSMHEGASLH